MGQIQVTKCPIEGLHIIEPKVHGDECGYFMETCSRILLQMRCFLSSQ